MEAQRPPQITKWWHKKRTKRWHQQKKETMVRRPPQITKWWHHAGRVQTAVVILWSKERGRTGDGNAPERQQCRATTIPVSRVLSAGLGYDNCGNCNTRHHSQMPPPQWKRENCRTQWQTATNSSDTVGRQLNSKKCSAESRGASLALETGQSFGNQGWGTKDFIGGPIMKECSNMVNVWKIKETWLQRGLIGGKSHTGWSDTKEMQALHCRV